MLKRINALRNVGPFSGCAPAQVPFGKWTVIYGRNTYGKSTLADILRSLSRNDPSPILDRESIPGDGTAQQIKLSFATDAENERDGIALFQRGVWERGLRDSHAIKVYDDAFYYSHVFLARSFSRETKTNFSSLVLGVSGVAAAREIAELKKKRRSLVGDMAKIRKAAFDGISDLSEFLAMKVAEEKAVLEERQDKLREEYRTLLNQKKNTAAILARQETVDIVFTTAVVDILRRLNLMLASSMDALHESARAAVAQHIANRMGSAERAETWLRQGLLFAKGDECQFCGQGLSEDARALLSAYQLYFDESFLKHEQRVAQQLNACLHELQADIAAPLLLALEKNEVALRLFPELGDNIKYSEIQQLHTRAKSQIELLLQAWRSLHQGLLTECATKAEAKRGAPHKSVDQVSLDGAEAQIAQLRAVAEEYNERVARPAAEVVRAFKKDVRPDVIDKRLEEVLKEGKSVARMITRLEKDSACIDYQEMLRDQVLLNKEIPQKQAALDKEQSEYIDRFFESINRNFDEFGSHDFSLNKGVDTSGHIPVYFLKVRYRESDVREARLGRILSESDRRALGLAVFWANLEALTSEELARTVVVLDDPVTSFDDHRVSATHRKVVQLLDRVEQVLLLSHYREGVAQLLNTYRFTKPITLVEVVKTARTSDFRIGDAGALCKSVHELKREEIFDFVERRREVVNAPLRVFLEEELSLRFAKQIRDNGIESDTLSGRIDALRECGVITEDLAARLHEWRQILNPEHHVWVGSDVEDQRNSARQFMEFLYHELVPAPVGAFAKAG